jgi:AcrR family transcriptional regulator
MVRRATATEATRQAIVAAAWELASSRFISDLTLDAVAARAGVSVRTVIRHFGGREGLIAAAFEAANSLVEQRDALTEPGDYADAVAALLDDYERWGDLLIKLLAQEPVEPALRGPLGVGRRAHEQWVQRVFADPLTMRRGRAGRLLLEELLAVTDVYMWHLLRRDRGLSRADTGRVMRQLMESVAEVR